MSYELRINFKILVFFLFGEFMFCVQVTQDELLVTN